MPSPPPAESPNTVTRAGIATERGDVVVHPPQCDERVEQPEVRDVAADRARVEEPERAEPVVRRDDDDLLLGCEPSAVVTGLRRTSRARTTRRGTRPSPGGRARPSVPTRSA